MHRRVLNLRRNLYKNKTKISLAIFIVFCCAVVGKIGFSYFYTIGNISGNTTINTLGFSPIVNDSAQRNQSINLSETITNNKNLAPGAIGKFNIDIDFSSVESDSAYRISFDRSNIPNNIKFYVDENLTKEITVIDGTQLAEYNNKTAEHYIYWKWIYSDTPESNANDSLYMNTNITVPYTVEIMQRTNYSSVKINNMKRPTGRVYLSGNSGSFNINLDFDGFESSSNYNIYFNKDNKSSVLHLYTDSEFQNEISSLPVSYDGVNNLVNNTIYWRLDDSSRTNLYYIVY